MDELTAITEYLLRFSPDALIVVDVEGQIRFANETVRDVLGHDPNALVGKPLDILIPERLRSRHLQHTGNFLQNPSSREMGARMTELFALRADGTEFPAGIRLSPFRIGGKLFVAAAIRDTTERTRANEEIIAAREEADRANRAKSRFLATASHDLRQPMQTIRLLNAAMSKVVPQPDIRELLEQQAEAIESMARLLNALLDISRLESGSIEPLMADVPLADVFAGLRSEFESIARTSGIRLEIDTPEFVLSTDRILFYQLLQNLLGNAIKYTERGSVRLICAADPDTLTIVVEDTGIGIPADKVERIFDEYYQVDTHGTKRMGVGLGLAIVKEVARLLGYTIRISSSVGRGTRARVQIPRAMVVTPAPANSTAAAHESAAVSRGTRVILVEDNDGVRLATETFLKIEGHQTASARSIAEAEPLVASMRPGDIVIADYYLDGRNTGLQLLLQTRERIGHQVPGIILSGDLPTVLRSIKSPVPNCRFLSKPVDTSALIEAIRELSTAGIEECSAESRPRSA